MHGLAPQAKYLDQPRILFVISVGLIAVPVLREQVRYLSELGLSVHVAAAYDPDLEAMLHSTGATLHPWLVRRDIGGLVSEMRTVSALWRIVGDVRPDLLVGGTPKAGLLGVLVGRIRRVRRVIYTLHGLRLEGSRGWRRRVLWLMELISCRASTTVHSVGNELSETALKLRLASRKRIEVVGSGSAAGINTGRFHPRSPSDVYGLRAELGWPTVGSVVGFVGRVTHDKGLGHLISLAGAMQTLFPDATLVVVGEGDGSDTRDAALLRELISMPNVCLVGRRSDMENVFPAMDILVLPSRREGLPTVVLEAGSCGVPSVVMGCTGARDAVAHGSTGLVVGAEATGQFIEGVVRLVEDAGLRASLGRSARERVEREFATEVFLPQLAAFYLARDSKEFP